MFDGTETQLGIIVQGGLYNGLMRALRTLGLADAFGASRIPDPRAERGLSARPRGDRRLLQKARRAVLVLEEGQPEFIEQEIATFLRRADVPDEAARQGLHAHGGRVQRRGAGARACRASSACTRRIWTLRRVLHGCNPFRRRRRKPTALLGALPQRPPTFCVGCPERPVFSAMKLVAQDIGRPHVSMDVGCHAFASFEPFSQGNTLLGYGMSLAAAAGVAPMSARRAGGDHGRRRLLAQRPAVGRRVQPAQQGRRRAGDHEERLRLGDRHPGAALLAAGGRAHGRGRAKRGRRRPHDREHA